MNTKAKAIPGPIAHYCDIDNDVKKETVKMIEE